MSQSGGNFLDSLLGGVKTVQGSGVTEPAEPTLNFIGAVVVDDPANSRTNVTLSADAHAVTGTGFWHSTSSLLDSAAKLVNLSTDTLGTLPLIDLQSSGASTNQGMVWTGTQWGPGNFVVSPGTAGQTFVTNAGPAAAWTNALTIDSTAYTGTTVATLKKVSSTSSSIIFSSPNLATAATINLNDNAAVYIGQGSLITNYILFNSSAGNTYTTFSASAHLFNDNGNVTYASLDGSGLILKGNGTTPFLRSDTTSTSFSVGTNKSGASLVLQSGAATTNQTLTATADAFGGSGATAPVTIDWSTSISPTILSGTSATNITIGPNKANATLFLGTGANAVAFSAESPSGTLRLNRDYGMTVAIQVSKAANYTIDSSGTGDEQVWIIAAATYTLPDPTNYAGRRLELIIAYDPTVSAGTIARHGSELINGAASNITLSGTDKFSVLLVRTNGTDWIIKGGTTV